MPDRPILASIQCLRGIAALLVVLSHAIGLGGLTIPGHTSALNDFFYLRDIGGVGVDILFVLSGFIMVYWQCPNVIHTKTTDYQKRVTFR